MSDAVTRLNAALEGRYAIERELGEGGRKGSHRLVTERYWGTSYMDQGKYVNADLSARGFICPR